MDMTRRESLKALISVSGAALSSFNEAEGNAPLSEKTVPTWSKYKIENGWLCWDDNALWFCNASLFLANSTTELMWKSFLRLNHVAGADGAVRCFQTKFNLYSNKDLYLTCGFTSPTFIRLRQPTWLGSQEEGAYDKYYLRKAGDLSVRGIYKDDCRIDGIRVSNTCDLYNSGILHWCRPEAELLDSTDTWKNWEDRYEYWKSCKSEPLTPRSFQKTYGKNVLLA